jgi:hypothetical protein
MITKIETEHEIDDLGSYFFVNELDRTITFIEIEHDHFPVNPLEDYDCYGQIFSFSRRHVNFLQLNAENEDEARKELELDYDYFLPLSYAEHGLCQWSVYGQGYQCPWDSVSFAGVYVPSNYEKEGLDAIKDESERHKKLVEFATSACNVYTAYCNGQVFGYKVTTYNLVKDEHGDDIECEDYYNQSQPEKEYDSCYGFYNLDDIKYEINVNTGDY